MSRASLSRQRRRALARTAEGVDRASESDRRFFRRFKSRSYRVRAMAPAEIDQLAAALDGELEALAPSEAWFVLMRQLAPGLRCKVFRAGPREQIGDELSEDMARALYDAHAAMHPQVRAREADILTVARRPGGPLHAGGAA